MFKFNTYSGVPQVPFERVRGNGEDGEIDRSELAMNVTLDPSHHNIITCARDARTDVNGIER